jgi:dihydroorotase
LDKLEGFVSRFGRAFYGRELQGTIEGKEKTVLRKIAGKRVDEQWVMGNESVVPFWAGKELRWEIVVD